MLAPQIPRAQHLGCGSADHGAQGLRGSGIDRGAERAGVPKGSCYHFFESKDGFGEFMMQAFFVAYLADMDRILADRTVSADRLSRTTA